MTGTEAHTESTHAHVSFSGLLSIARMIFPFPSAQSP